MILYFCPDTTASRYGQRIRAAAIARKRPEQIMVGTRFEGNSLFVPDGVCHVQVKDNVDQIVKDYTIHHVVIDGVDDDTVWRVPTTLIGRDDFQPVTMRGPEELVFGERSGVLVTSTGPDEGYDVARVLEAWPHSYGEHHFPLIEVMPHYQVVVAPAGRAIWETQVAGAHHVAFARHEEEVVRAERFGVKLVNLNDASAVRVAIHTALQAPQPKPVANKAEAVAQSLVDIAG